MIKNIEYRLNENTSEFLLWAEDDQLGWYVVSKKRKYRFPLNNYEATYLYNLLVGLKSTNDTENAFLHQLRLKLEATIMTTEEEKL